MKMKKFLAVCLSALTVTGMLAGCPVGHLGKQAHAF